MPGTSWLKAPRTPQWKPGIHRAQRFFHLAALLPISPAGLQSGVAAALGLGLPAEGGLEPDRASDEEGQATGTELDLLRRQLVDATERVEPGVADGGRRRLRYG